MNKIFDSKKYHKIETERLIMIKLKYSDKDFIYSLYSKKKVMKYMQSPVMKNIEDAEKFVKKMKKMYQKKKGIRWIIYNKKNVKEPLGTFAIHYYNKASKRAELGADLLPKYWNKGYISEITSYFINNMFKKLNLNRIEIRCMPENKASIYIAKKYDFTYEGTLREYVFVEDKGFTDEMVFSLLKSDTEDS